MFNVPNQQDVDREGFSLPSEGRHDLTLTGVEAKKSSSGNPMMVFKLTIDSGEDAGHSIRHFFTFTDQTSAWSELACLCDAASFEWSEASSLEAFAAQFPLNKLRFSADIEHRYTATAFLDEPNKWKYNEKSPTRTETCTHKTDYVELTKEEYDEWESDDKYVGAQIRDGLDFQSIYQPPQNSRELAFDDDETFTPSGDGSSEKLDTTVSDDLPF